MLPEVLETMLPYFRDTYGNPQSLHDWGDEARETNEEARGKVAALIGAQPEEIIFTGSGTEANNFAIKGLAQAQQSKGKHLVISAIEHFSVLHSVKMLEKMGFEATLVPVDGHGLVDSEEVAKSMKEDTILVSVMHANGEVGTIEPIAEIAEVVKKTRALFHTDACKIYYYLFLYKPSILFLLELSLKSQILGHLPDFCQVFGHGRPSIPIGIIGIDMKTSLIHPHPVFQVHLQ